MKTQFDSVRERRLESDYKEMLKIRSCPNIKWEITKGKAPYVEEYLITLKIRTYKSKEQTMDSCKVRVTLSDQYPKVAPNIVMLDPKIFHPNWYESGRFCPGKFLPSESLGSLVIRMIRTIQFDSMVTNPNSPANRDAASWYENNINKGIFPTDNTELPIPKVNAFKVIK